MYLCILNPKNMAIKNKTTEKKGATKGKAPKKKSQVVRIPKISWVVKPDRMTLEEWQRALRKQIAGEETMAVAAVDEKNLPGEYEVKNPQARGTIVLAWTSKPIISAPASILRR